MVNRRLSTAEAAERLGVKPATLYAYASRGLLQPRKGPAGSTYDPREVARLARSARRPGGAGRAEGRRDRAAGEEPVFVTEITLIRGGRLFYRGLDAVELSRQRSFEEVAQWLWSAAWPEAPAGWELSPPVARRLRRALAGVPAGALPVERFATAVVAVSLADELRHGLQPAGVPVTGRSLLSALAASLPLTRPDPAPGGPLAERVWGGLSRLPCDGRAASAMQAALVLAADHELAPSTLAARVAAAFRADPYAVVLTGLGPAGGTWTAGSTGAPSEVESLLEEAAAAGAERAVGERLRRTGEVPHGFGMPLYPGGDPRGRELLGRVARLGSRDRREVVAAVVDVAARRGFPPPNFDLGLGALSFCAEMVAGAGQAVFTFAKVAGWLAHAVEEYTDPTRFRSRADYVGVVPPP